MDKRDIFNALYNSHYTKVLRLCRGYFGGNEAAADEATQEVFIKVWESLDSFRNESAISTWLYRITVNTCLLHLRKSSTKKEIATDSFPKIIAESDHDEKEEQLRQMYQCIQKLEKPDQIIILMTLEGIAYSEIAEVVGISEDNLRVRIHRIKKKLTQCVQNENI